VIYCASRHIVFTILPLLKKWLCLQLEVQLPLPKNALVIIKFINDKMIQMYFFYYSIISYLPFKARKTRLRARGSFVFCKNKNGVFTFIPFDPKKIKIISEGVFVLLIWFCCNSQVVSRVFGYFKMHNLLFKFEDGWRVFQTSQQVGTSGLFLGGACDAQIAPNVAFQGGVCCTSPLLSQWWGVCSRSWHLRALEVSFSLPPLLENRVGHCKKTRKHDYLFVK